MTTLEDYRKKSKDITRSENKSQEFLGAFSEFAVLNENPEKKGVLYVCKWGVGRSRSVACRVFSWGRRKSLFSPGWC